MDYSIFYLEEQPIVLLAAEMEKRGYKVFIRGQNDQSFAQYKQAQIYWATIVGKKRHVRIEIHWNRSAKNGMVAAYITANLYAYMSNSIGAYEKKHQLSYNGGDGKWGCRTADNILNEVDHHSANHVIIKEGALQWNKFEPKTNFEYCEGSDDVRCNIQVQRCKVLGMYAVGKSLDLQSAAKPDRDVFFLLQLSTYLNNCFIVTDGDRWLPVVCNTLWRIKPDTKYKLEITEIDVQLMNAAMEYFANKVK